jgi:hypothetical protein
MTTIPDILDNFINNQSLDIEKRAKEKNGGNMDEQTLKELRALWDKCEKEKMSQIRSSGDNKWAEMGAGDNFGLEVDTDDCDRQQALNSAKFLRALWNAWYEMEEGK